MDLWIFPVAAIFVTGYTIITEKYKRKVLLL